MDFFNTKAKNKLIQALNVEDNFKLIAIWGNQGVGKTHLAHSVLDELGIVSIDIIFSSECFFPLGSFAYEEWRDNNNYNILMKCTKTFKDGKCIIFQNMEKCNDDYNQLILQLINYHKNSNQRLFAILEYNSNTKPLDNICSFVNCTVQVKEDNEMLNEYLNYYFSNSKKNALLFKKIINISNGNIETFLCTLNILQQLNIISQDKKGYFNYRSTNYVLPDNILSLYSILLDELDKYQKEPLLAAAPFDVHIYENLIRSLFIEYSNFEEYLNVLSKHESVITDNKEVFWKNADLFHSSYYFLTENVRNAVMTKLDENTIRKRLDAYYIYFDRIYNNPQEYSRLNDSDKEVLLFNLAKKRKRKFAVNQIKYIVDLMKYYQEHFLYYNAIEEGDKLLSSDLLNVEQLNIQSHEFWVIYFSSLITLGKYETIINYKDVFKDDDLNYNIAYALYQLGNPLESLKVLEEKVSDNKNILGYKYNLMASVYDWVGDGKKSKKCFELAIKNYNNDLQLLNQLYKKYSMYVDFRISQCQEKMHEAINYYESKDLKQYAECLHNYGTSCIFNFEYENASYYLNQSKNVLDKVCSNEIYYVLNSIAILKCYKDENYIEAINNWKSALQYDISVEFCRMAIYNNMFNVYVNINELQLATEIKNQIEQMVFKRNISFSKINKEKNDIQHELCHYFYNCGLLYKKQQHYSKSLDMLKKAKKSCLYDSKIQYSINRNIDDIMMRLKQNKSKKIIINKERNPHPTPIEKFMYDRNMYLCEIMFWG